VREEEKYEVHCKDRAEEQKDQGDVRKKTLMQA
jgi:hypothetical protein